MVINCWMHSLLLSLLYKRWKRRADPEDRRTETLKLASSLPWLRSDISALFGSVGSVNLRWSIRIRIIGFTSNISRPHPPCWSNPSDFIVNSSSSEQIFARSVGLISLPWTCDVFLIIFKLGPRVDCKANDRASSRRFLSSVQYIYLQGPGTSSHQLWSGSERREARGGGLHLWPLLQSCSSVIAAASDMKQGVG